MPYLTQDRLRIPGMIDRDTRELVLQVDMRLAGIVTAMNERIPTPVGITTETVQKYVVVTLDDGSTIKLAVVE